MRFWIFFFSFVICIFTNQLFSNGEEAGKSESKAFPKEIAIIQLSFDGVNTFHCGVGTVIQQTQMVIKEWNEKKSYPIHFKLYLISGAYSWQLPEYSFEILNKNIKDCRASGGEVHLIPIINNEDMFGEPEQWKKLCEEGAKLCSQIINQNAYTIVISHDTAFAQLSLNLGKLDCQGEVKNAYQKIWVPHSTSWGYNGHTSDGLPHWPQRHEWELTAFQQAVQGNYKIGYISPSIKQQVTSPPFNVPEKPLVYYPTGILLDKYLEPIPEELIKEELKKNAIPIDKRLIFSVGRANPLKGLDITLEMYRHLKNRYSDIHLVLLAPPSDFLPSYLPMLKKRIEKECLEVTLIDYFDLDLANFIYQWPKTAITCLLSRMDTRPLTVMEARVNPVSSILLVSDPERMGKQVTHGIDGFICSLKNLDSIIEAPCPLNDSLECMVNCACQILELSNEERNRIIDSGKKLIKENYDLRENMKRNLKTFLEIGKGDFLRSEDRTKNPLYKSLPSLMPTFQELLSLPPQESGFIPVPFRESLEANWFPTEGNFFEDIGVQQSEKAFNTFCEKIASNSSPSPSFSIPPIIHFIWMGSPPTPAVNAAIESWKRHNPNLEIKLWTEKEIEDFVWSELHSKKFFEEGKNWAEKSDILRFEILYQYGGVYSDTDVVCTNSVEDLLTNDLNFFAGFESNKIKRFGRPLVGCSVLGAARNCPVIKRCLDFSQTAEEAPTIHQHLRSGPGPTSKAAYEALENGAEGVLVLPCSYLYPMPWEKRLSTPSEVAKNIRPETFAIHLWEGSWFDFYYPPKVMGIR